MNSQKAVSRAELCNFVERNRLAELVRVFQRLPVENQIAIEFYLKGRLDAGAAITEIPLEYAGRVGRQMRQPATAR